MQSFSSQFPQRTVCEGGGGRGERSEGRGRLASSPVPVKEFLLIEMLYEWGNVLLKPCHLDTEGVAGQRSGYRPDHTYQPDVEVGIIDVAQSKVVCSGQNLNAMRECSLSPYILLECCLGGGAKI